MNVATAIALFLMNHQMGVDAVKGHTWSYERLQDSAMVCINDSCIVVPDAIVAEPVEPEIEA